MPLRSIKPATNQTLAVFDEHDAATVERKLRLAAEAFDHWRRTPVGERAGSLTRLAERLEAEKAELDRLMTLEMGKPIGAAIEEAAKCALACRYYAEHGERFLARETVRTDASESYVVYLPLGVVLAVMPWKFPFWQLIRFAAPGVALIAFAIVRAWAHYQERPRSASQRHPGR
jgi:succinate-semialdehyde dehydrogenase/glutarate-semialdehyde dehydrogenase